MTTMPTATQVMPTATQVLLLRALRRDERPSAEHFAVEPSVALPLPLGAGQVLVRVIYTSVDPYLFQYALLQPSNVGPVQSRAVGVVEDACEAPGFPVGSFVYGSFGWASHAVVSAGGTVSVTMADGSKRVVAGSDGFRRIELPVAPRAPGVPSPLPRFLGVLGMPGLAAYAGVARIIRPSAGKAVFISSAAGAVGLVAGQVARLLGARVVGSTSSAAKCEFLLQHGFDAAFNYRACGAGGYSAALAEHFPDGIDGYFDCVGGEMLDAVLGLANDHAAIAVCGIISTLPPPGSVASSSGGAAAPEHVWRFEHFSRVLTKQLRLEGFQARDHFDLFPEYCEKMGAWLDSGEVKYAESIAQGLEGAPAALMAQLEGQNLGKQLVQVSEDPLAPAAAPPAAPV